VNPKTPEPSVRLKRLEALADLWGKVYLFHPAIVSARVQPTPSEHAGRVQPPFSSPESGGSPLDWHQALVRAIPKVEAAGTPDELAAAVNEELLQLLDDPLTFAEARRDRGIEGSRDRVTDGRLETRRIAESVGYVRVPPPTARGPEFLSDFQAAVEALGEVKLLAVDLRWPSAFGYRTIDPVLQFFVRSRLQMSPVMKRVHVGWNEDNSLSAYQQKWEVSAGAGLHPIQQAEWFVAALSPGTDFTKLKTIATPTVLLVNRPFASRYYRVLDALQSQPGVAVVLEPSGPPIAEPPFRLAFPEGVAVQLNTELLVGHGGQAGFRPNVVTDEPIGTDKLAAVAEQALTAGARGEGRGARDNAADLINLRLPAVLAETGRSLSREERLLGLFKVWNVIRHLDPHVGLCDMDWSACLAEWIPKVEEADSPLAYARTLRMLTAHLHDNNVFYFFPNLPESQSLPVFFGWAEGKIVVTDVGLGTRDQGLGTGHSETPSAVSREPSAVSGLEVGEEVVEFDGKTVEELVAEHKQQVSYSTEGSFYQRMCDMLAFGPAGSEVKLVVRRRRDMTEGLPRLSAEENRGCTPSDTDRVPGKMGTVPCEGTVPILLKRTVTREARVAYSARRRESSGYRVLDGNIGYLDLGLLASLREFERAFEALRQTRGLIVDIRRHPGFTMQLALAARLSDRPVKSAIYEIPIVSSFDSQEQVVSIGQYDVQPDAKAHYGGPVVVLVNEKTHGSAEDVCIYLKNAARVTFVGGTTAGCNGNRTWLSLPGGGRLWFTGMRVKFGDGSRFQNIGITPDVPAAPTVEGVRAGRDEVLDRGLEVLKGRMSERSQKPDARS